MKTILIITVSLSEKNGVGRYSQELVERLCKNFKLIIFTGKDDKCFKSPQNCQVFPILPNFSNFFKLRNPLIFIPCVWKILKFSRGVDAVHSFMDYPHSFLASIVSVLIGKPLILTANGTYSLEPFNMWPDRYFHKFALRRAKTIICISRFTQIELRKRINISTDVLINDGINFNKFGNYRFIEKRKNHSQILSVGTLKFRKGYHVSIPALVGVKKEYPDIKYYIVGNHNNKAYWGELKSIVAKYKLEDNVAFLENIDDGKLIDLYYSSDIFVLTSVNMDDNFEGFGLVYLEAGACGKPVVGAYGSGAEDAIIDGQTGLLVPQGDVNKTTEAILRLLDNPEIARKMGESGKKFAQRMDWDNVVKKYIEIYESD